MTEDASLIFLRPEVAEIRQYVERTVIDQANIDKTWQSVREQGYTITRETWRNAVHEMQNVFYRGDEATRLPDYLTPPERLFTQSADYTERYAVKMSVVGVLADGGETEPFGLTLEYGSKPSMGTLRADMDEVMNECPEMPTYQSLRVVSSEYWRKG